MSLFDWIVALVLVAAGVALLLWVTIVVLVTISGRGTDFDWYRDDERRPR